MGIRHHKKDHLRELAPVLSEVPSASLPTVQHDPLVFWTRHERPVLVNLKTFSKGDDGTTDAANARTKTPRPFTGRPALIGELAPALHALLEYAAPATVAQYQHALREWWRLFDTVEKIALKNGEVQRVQSVGDIGELHRQRAHDDNLDGGSFCLLAAFNIVRKTKEMRRLNWRRPAAAKTVRNLPKEAHVQEIRHALRRNWFATLDRWNTADELLSGRAPSDAEEERLLKNYNLFKATVDRVKDPRPCAEELRGEIPTSSFSTRGFNVPDMLRGRYPDADDIRCAFHLCLISTGWNPSTLLALDANTDFIQEHPKDPSRYLLRGYKARSKSEQQNEGLYKSQGSAGIILKTLQRRSAPLRARLRKELEEHQISYERLLLESAPQEEIDSKQKVINRLRIGLSSVWLYAVSALNEIVWLDLRNYSFTRLSAHEPRESFIASVVRRVNRRRPATDQIAQLTPSDFRDAFAAYAYRISGGMVLYVMKALGHSSLRATKIYLDNVVLNEQSVQLYQTFSNTLWSEIKLHKRLDPTVIAQCSREGSATDAQRERLESYRRLRRSRIGVGCKDPTRPPRHIAPNFRADGKSMCHVHRCTLCLENAVIFPDSLPGLTKRLAELRAIRRRMSVIAFIESSFGEELQNTEIALGVFDLEAVTSQTRDWEEKIGDGRHRVIELDGVQEYA